MDSDMQIYSFGPSSKKEIATCHKDVRFFLYEAIRTTPLSVGDWSVINGGRNKKKQTLYFNTGKSSAQWGDSWHNFMMGDKMCSLAVDVAPWCPVQKKNIWDDDELWDKLHDHFYKVAKRLGMKIQCGVVLKNGKKDQGHIYFKLR